MLPSRENLIGIIGVLIVVLFFLALSLNFRTGPQEQIVGTVQGAMFAQHDGSASKVVSVHLHNGHLVTIVVSQNQVLQPGQVIVLDVYRRFLTGSLTYGMAPHNKQPKPETVTSHDNKGSPAYLILNSSLPSSGKVHAFIPAELGLFDTLEYLRERDVRLAPIAASMARSWPQSNPKIDVLRFCSERTFKTLIRIALFNTTLLLPDTIGLINITLT